MMIHGRRQTAGRIAGDPVHDAGADEPARETMDLPPSVTSGARGPPEAAHDNRIRIPDRARS